MVTQIVSNLWRYSYRFTNDQPNLLMWIKLKEEKYQNKSDNLSDNLLTDLRCNINHSFYSCVYRNKTNTFLLCWHDSYMTRYYTELKKINETKICCLIVHRK